MAQSTIDVVAKELKMESEQSQRISPDHRDDVEPGKGELYIRQSKDRALGAAEVLEDQRSPSEAGSLPRVFIP